jgi:hypothetical protein
VPHEDDNASILSLQELEPSPVDGWSPDLESGEYFPRTEAVIASERNLRPFLGLKLGLSGRGWDSWCMFK